MIIDEIRRELFALQDRDYRDFQIKLIPTAEEDGVIGVRTPQLRALAKKLFGEEELEVFLNDLPHRFFDENQLHAFLLSGMKDYDACIARTEQFLPFVDNWATCDQMSPKCFRKHREDLLEHIEAWLSSDRTYTVRFAIGMLMEHFLEEDFDLRFPQAVAAVRSEEYYINMMIAWYFATALAKQYDSVLPFLEQERLEPWTHNKAIQKALESYRITPEQKAYLRTLKIRKPGKKAE